MARAAVGANVLMAAGTITTANPQLEHSVQRSFLEKNSHFRGDSYWTLDYIHSKNKKENMLVK